MSPTAVTGISRTRNPYPRQGVQADGRGIPRYTELPGSLIAMLARHVETGLDVEAVVEVGGQRLAYRQLWDRAARVAGGLQAECDLQSVALRGGQLVQAIQHPPGVPLGISQTRTLVPGGRFWHGQSARTPGTGIEEVTSEAHRIPERRPPGHGQGCR